MLPFFLAYSLIVPLLGIILQVKSFAPGKCHKQDFQSVFYKDKFSQANQKIAKLIKFIHGEIYQHQIQTKVTPCIKHIREKMLQNYKVQPALVEQGSHTNQF